MVFEDPHYNGFESYLCNRSHYVELEINVKSKNIQQITGLPQGSILGPLLFIIYMNDIQFASAYFNFILYADDTSLIQPLFKFNMETNFDDLNTELSKIYEWLCINKLFKYK